MRFGKKSLAPDVRETSRGAGLGPGSTRKTVGGADFNSIGVGFSFLCHCVYLVGKLMVAEMGEE